MDGFTQIIAPVFWDWFQRMELWLLSFNARITAQIERIQNIDLTDEFISHKDVWIFLSIVAALCCFVIIVGTWEDMLHAPKKWTGCFIVLVQLWFMFSFETGFYIKAAVTIGLCCGVALLQHIRDKHAIRSSKRICVSIPEPEFTALPEREIGSGVVLSEEEDDSPKECVLQTLDNEANPPSPSLVAAGVQFNPREDLLHKNMEGDNEEATTEEEEEAELEGEREGELEEAEIAPITTVDFSYFSPSSNTAQSPDVLGNNSRDFMKEDNEYDDRFHQQSLQDKVLGTQQPRIEIIDLEKEDD